MEAMHACPPIEVLEKFAAGQLPEPEAAAFEHHLAACGICSLVIERLGDFDDAAQTVLNSVEPDWAQMQRSLGLDAPSKPAARKPWWSGLFGRPALGYALAVVLAYPAWLGVSGRRWNPGPQEPAVAWASSVDLNTTRSLRSIPSIGTEAGERAAALHFFAPAVPGGKQFASIRDARGGLVMDLGEMRSGDGQHNFVIVVDPRKLAAGRYRLVVRTDGRESDEKTFEFDRR